MTALTHDFIENHDLLDGSDAEGWAFVGSKELSDYEGDKTTQFVYRNKETGELWAFDYHSNSWSEIFDSARDVDIYQVEPRTRVVIDYIRIKKA